MTHEKVKKYTRREKERRLVGRQKHLCAFLFKLREKMEGKNQNIRIELGLNYGLLRKEEFLDSS